MNTCPIMVCSTDLESLSDLVANLHNSPFADRQQLRGLDETLQSACIVRFEQLPPDVIRMNSSFWVLDLNSAKRTRYQLVFPENADIASGKLSILAPLGFALLGRAKGQVLEAQVPGGLRTLRVEQVWQRRRKRKCYGSPGESSQLTTHLLQEEKIAA